MPVIMGSTDSVSVQCFRFANFVVAPVTHLNLCSWNLFCDERYQPITLDLAVYNGEGDENRVELKDVDARLITYKTGNEFDSMLVMRVVGFADPASALHKYAKSTGWKAINTRSFASFQSEWNTVSFIYCDVHTGLIHCSSGKISKNCISEISTVAGSCGGLYLHGTGNDVRIGAVHMFDPAPPVKKPQVASDIVVAVLNEIEKIDWRQGNGLAPRRS
jgi:hypothetical protein